MKRLCLSKTGFRIVTRSHGRRMNHISGFTLIELMISLTLGLIVTATAVLLLLTGQRSVAMQKGVAELQDNANFGLNYMTKDIRLTNLNTSIANINDKTLYGGVVIQYSNLPTDIIENRLFSQSGEGLSNVEDDTGTAFKSDQLVIQYLPQYTIQDDEYVGGFDCEGNEIRYAKNENLRIYVQRYFLREDINKVSNESSSLALACDAGYYQIGSFHAAVAATATSPAISATIPATAPTKIIGFGGGSQIIMKRVDHFRVLLGIQSTTTHQYVSIKNYMAMTSPRPRILSIQLATLVRSTQSLGGDSAVKTDQKFKLLDQTVKVKTSTDPKYIRQVVSQTIALRNALGERE